MLHILISLGSQSAVSTRKGNLEGNYDVTVANNKKRAGYGRNYNRNIVKERNSSG